MRGRSKAVTAVLVVAMATTAGVVMFNADNGGGDTSSPAAKRAPAGVQAIGQNDGGHPMRTYNLDAAYLATSAETIVIGTVESISDPYPGLSFPEVDKVPPLPANTVTMKVTEDPGSSQQETFEFVVLDNSAAVKVGDRILVATKRQDLGDLKAVNVPIVVAQPRDGGGWRMDDGDAELVLSASQIQTIGSSVAERVSKGANR